jgi:hypothetical protein
MSREEIYLSIDVFNPSTLPMSRLADYLRPFAAMLGSESSIHFEKVDDGTAKLRAYIDEPAIPKVRERISEIAIGSAPKVAQRAFKEVDDLLAKDNATGFVAINNHRVIQFPGKMRPSQETIGPVRRNSPIEGQIFSIGGKDETINIHLMDRGQEIRCIAPVSLARKLGPYLLGSRIRLSGHGQWVRVDGNWQLKAFHAEDFSVLEDVPLENAISSIGQTFAGINPDQFLAAMWELRHG